MKFNKKIFKYKLFRLFSKRYSKIFNSIYKQKLNNVLLDLIKKGVEINIIYDIGAYRGEFSDYLNQSILKKRSFYLFEANKKNSEYLDKLNFRYFIGALSDSIKEVTFYSKSLSGDSYYREQTSFYDSSDGKNILTNTLDDVSKSNNLPFPDFIKIDTQGSELDILKGGKKTISRCKLIYMECPIIEYNAGSPKLDDYISFLDSIDFVPYDICEVHHIDNILVQADIIFIRKPIFRKIFPQKTILNIIN